MTPSESWLVALISRTYFDSDECRKELDRFLGCLKRSDGHGGLPDVPGGGRKLVPVFKHPPRTDQELPRELAEDEWFAVSVRYETDQGTQYSGTWQKETSWQVSPDIFQKYDPARPG